MQVIQSAFTCSSSHQGAEGPPRGLGHPEVVQDPGEDGSLLGAVDLQGAGSQDLHPVQVQRGCQVVGDLATDRHDAAGAALSERTRHGGSAVSPSAWRSHRLTAAADRNKNAACLVLNRGDNAAVFCFVFFFSKKKKKHLKPPAVLLNQRSLLLPWQCQVVSLHYSWSCTARA